MVESARRDGADRSIYSSWAAIADTSGQTDEEVQERRAATAAYRLIVALREDSKRYFRIWRYLGLKHLSFRNPSRIHAGT